jgi:hypothetical protein
MVGVTVRVVLELMQLCGFIAVPYLAMWEWNAVCTTCITDSTSNVYLTNITSIRPIHGSLQSVPITITR